MWLNNALGSYWPFFLLVNACLQRKGLFAAFDSLMFHLLSCTKTQGKPGDAQSTHRQIPVSSEDHEQSTWYRVGFSWAFLEVRTVVTMTNGILESTLLSRG